MAPHSSALAWKVPWIEESGGLQPMGSLGVRHDLKDNGNTLLQVADSAGNFVMRNTNNGQEIFLEAEDLGGILRPGAIRVGTAASATAVGFHNTDPIVKPSVTGSRGGNAALASLLTKLDNYGFIADNTTA